MIIMHSYTYRRYPVVRALQKAKQYGYDGLELSSCHWGWSQAEMVAHLDETFSLAEQIGVPIRVVDFIGNFVSPDPAVRERSLAELEALLQRVKGLGVTAVNGGVGPVLGGDAADWNANGSAAASDDQWLWAAESLKRAAEAAEKAGVLVTLEVHMNTLHDTAAATARLLDAVGSDRVKAALDCGNMLPLSRAEAPAEAVRLLGSRLGYVHLKNCRMWGAKADYSLSLEAGDIDYYAVAVALREVGYTGDYCIEYCGQGDPSPRAEGDIQYWQSLLAEAGLSA